MNQYDPKKIEELQLVLLKNPRSPVFAGLAEAYRKMGLLEEALEVTTRGIKHNPEYVSGLVAHAKILYELKDFRQAVKVLTKAHLLKPENILAMKLLGHGLLKLRKHREALQIFKKLLIAKPDDENVAKIVQKWEFLDNIAPQENPSKMALDGYEHWIQQLPSENHVIHLIDSFMNYGDNENALDIATSAMAYWPESKDIKRRQELLVKRQPEGENPEENFMGEEENPALAFLKMKRDFYERCLQRIEQRKSIDPS